MTLQILDSDGNDLTKDKWFRICPICGNYIEYTNKRSWYNAKASGAKCKECHRKQLSEIFTGKPNPNYPKNRRSKLNKSDFTRDCPDCGKTLYYSAKWNLDTATRNDTVCDGCANYKYKKTWNDVITNEHIKTMRATKAGFTSWQEYEEKYPAKKQYQQEVRRLTRFQPIETLSNFSKLDENRGLNGVEGAYQLDHIISVDSGWNAKIPPHYIAHVSNLQVLSWEENITKGKSTNPYDVISPEEYAKRHPDMDLAKLDDVLVGYKSRIIWKRGIVNVPHIPGLFNEEK